MYGHWATQDAFCFFLVKISLEFIPYLEIKPEDEVLDCSYYQAVLWGLGCDKPSRVEVAWCLRGGAGVCGEPGGCWDTEDRSLWWEETVGAVSKVIDQGTDCDLSRRWSHGSEWLFLTFGQWILFSTEACPVIICSFLTRRLDRDQLLEMPMKVRPSQVHWLLVSFIYLFN